MRRELGAFGDLRFFQAGETLELGDLRIETVPTPHDCADGVGFVAANGGKRIGVLTDLGHVFDGLVAVVRSLDAVFLESNYDPDLLRAGLRPRQIKDWIRGPGGHLSNYESAQLLGRVGAGRLRWACLAHLSRDYNDADLALRTHRAIVPGQVALCVASRHEPFGILEV